MVRRATAHQLGRNFPRLKVCVCLSNFLGQIRHIEFSSDLDAGTEATYPTLTPRLVVVEHIVISGFLQFVGQPHQQNPTLSFRQLGKGFRQ